MSERILAANAEELARLLGESQKAREAAVRARKKADEKADEAANYARWCIGRIAEERKADEDEAENEGE